MEKALIQMENIHKWFGKVHALKAVNIKIWPGEIVGLVGDNGAGKSTLIKILAGVILQDKGEIYWNEKKVDISSVDDSRKLGIETLFQEQSIIGILSVMRNVFLGREKVKSWGLMKILDNKNMGEESMKLVRQLGLNIASPNQEVRFCSGGEQQGVALSRAMYFKAKLVILDEPCRALGVKGVEQISNFVKELRNKKIGVIFITHNLYHVYPVASRFIALSRGEKTFDVQKKNTSFNKLQVMMAKVPSRNNLLS
jgi:simple sugar transport system ATP-binding protein